MGCLGSFPMGCLVCFPIGCLGSLPMGCLGCLPPSLPPVPICFCIGSFEVGLLDFPIGPVVRFLGPFFLPVTLPAMGRPLPAAFLGPSNGDFFFMAAIKFCIKYNK